MLTRPERDLYVNNPPETYEEPYYTSTWNGAGGRLPVIYKLLSDKFPVNNFDDIDHVSFVEDYNGYAKLVLSGTYETYNNLEYIKVSNASVSAYNGIWQITQKLSATSFVINCAFSATSTADFQRYYKNYQANVKVFCGIPPAHALASLDPISEIANIKITPNPNNICIVDVTAFVKEKLGLDFQTELANDITKWTSFYIQYAESYDVSDGTQVTSFTSEYTTDTYPGCGGEKISNGTFTGSIAGWDSFGLGSAWLYGSNDARTTKGANTQSNKLAQEINIQRGVPYNLSFTASNSESPYPISYRVILNYSFGPVEIFNGDLSASSESMVIPFVAIEDYCSIEFEVVAFSPGRTLQYLALDNVSVISSDCTAYLFGINGVRQFQNVYGGNFGDYVMNFNGQVYDNKFLTVFENPVLFDGQYFDISCIIPAAQFQISKDSKLYCKVDIYNKEQYISSADKEIVNLSDGVYKIKLSDVEYAGGDRIKIRLYRLPYNIFSAGDSGNFDYTDDPFSSPPSDWGLTGNVEYIPTLPYAGIGCAEVFGITGGQTRPIGYRINAIYNTDPISVTPNTVYKISGYVKYGESSPGASNFTNRSTFYLLPVGYNVSDCISTGSYVINTAAQNDGATNTWRYIETVFNTNANTSIQVGGAYILTSPVGAGNTVGTMLDVFRLVGPYDWISEEKTIKIDSSCTKQAIALRWVNPLGGDEYFTFKAVKDYETSIEDSREFTRDVFNDWDTGFINGQTQDDNLDITAYWTVTVRAQFLTEDQVKAIGGDRSKGTAGIVGSIRVTDITDVNNPITVRVDKRSIKVRKDKQKLHTIEFDIRYPRIEIQNQ